MNFLVLSATGGLALFLNTLFDLFPSQTIVVLIVLLVNCDLENKLRCCLCTYSYLGVLMPELKALL